MSPVESLARPNLKPGQPRGFTLRAPQKNLEVSALWRQSISYRSWEPTMQGWGYWMTRVPQNILLRQLLKCLSRLMSRLPAPRTLQRLAAPMLGVSLWQESCQWRALNRCAGRLSSSSPLEQSQFWWATTLHLARTLCQKHPPCISMYWWYWSQSSAGSSLLQCASRRPPDCTRSQIHMARPCRIHRIRKDPYVLTSRRGQSCLRHEVDEMVLLDILHS